MEHHGERNSLGKLLPKAITARRRKKHSRDTGDSDLAPEEDDHAPSSSASQSGSHPSDDALRATARSHARSANTSAPANGSRSRGRSRSRDESVSMADPDETTSPVSYESDPDVASRPHAISTHPSQIGYLTTSSPIVPDAHLKGGQPDPVPRSATFDATGVASTDITALQPAALASSKTGLAPPQSSSSRRSPSPAGRFRDVFRSRKTASPASSPERRPDQQPELDNNPAASASQASATAPNPTHQQQSSSTSGRPRTQSKPNQPRIDVTAAPPRTPPTSDKAAPVIVNTPPTPTDSIHPHPQQSPTKRSFVSSPDARPPSAPPASTSNSWTGGAPSTRRTRAGSNASIGPSKLSNITLPPLTPTPENSGSGTSTPSASGFFSSVISAAQNAATSFSNTIATSNIGAAKGKPGGPAKDKDRETKDSAETSEDGEVTQAEMSSQSSDQKELAVNTLGQGSLSLSQLGLVDSGSTATTPTTSKFPDSSGRHRSDSAPAEPGFGHPHDSPGDDSLALPRPISLYDSAAPGERTPPPASVYDGKSGLQRSGSIRSAIGSARRRRGGSTATGTTIGAAISAVTASVGNPSANASAPKLTGFAVASKKRNRDFHNLFKSVPDDDYLIEDYSCALQREILAHGRLYVSEGHLCFSSNIFGWVTTLVMGFDEIVSVEKRSTALVFKNGLMISTLHAKHVFASFTSRDSTYDLIVNIWKLGHPSLRSSLNGVRLDETGGDKTEKVDVEPVADAAPSGSESEEDEEESEDGEDVYDEDEDNADTPETTQAPDPSPPNGEAEKTASRKVSGPALATSGGGDKAKEAPAAPTTDADFPGPAVHSPTDCGDEAHSHFDKIMGDDVIPAPLGKVYNMVFGPPTWMSKFITGDQKCTELQTDEKAGLTLDNKAREYTYIKPLNGPIGPKQTKCIVSENLDVLDFNKAASVTVTTQTPDVPSGNVFNVKTKYCLSWAESNHTRIQMTCTIEWTGKSWLKGPIEKGTIDGQTQYAKDLFAALKSGVASRSRSGTLTNGAAAKPGKKKGKKGKQVQPVSPAAEVETAKINAKQSWGVFEPVQPFLGPVVDIIGPILTGNVVYGLLVGLLVATWFGFGFPSRSASGVGPPYGLHDPAYLYYPDRIAAYEEMWRREESDLWDWLEERVSLDRLGRDALNTRKRAVEPRTLEERLREERMDAREMDEAIRVTEEKLKILKEVVSRRRAEGSSKSEE